jgi:hypothetical protein
MTRLLAWGAAVLLLAFMVAALLMTNVFGDRGRGEVDLTSIHEVPVASGGVLTQPVPLQRAAPYAIELPYQWRGSQPARIEVLLVGADGSTLSDTTETLDNSRAPIWLQPIGDGSNWQHESAAFHAIRLPSNASGTVVLQLTRLDQEAGNLVFFASNVSSGASRPSLVQRPAEFLDLETVYGAPRPAIDKVATYVSRVQSLAPPWLPFPLLEVLFALTIAIGIYLYATVLGRPSEGVSPTRSR